MELQNVKKTAVGILLFLILSGLCGCGSRPEDPVLPEQHKQQHQQEIEETEEEQNEEKNEEKNKEDQKSKEAENGIYSSGTPAERNFFYRKTCTGLI